LTCHLDNHIFLLRSDNGDDFVAHISDSPHVNTAEGFWQLWEHPSELTESIMLKQLSELEALIRARATKSKHRTH
jgi:hypothetical protein